MLQIGLWLAVAIDGLLNIPFFLSISYTPLLQVAFIAIAAIAVLFKVYALLQGWKFLWSLLAIATLFASLSMALFETSNHDSKQVDTTKIESYKRWSDLQEQFKQATKQVTMELLQEQIKQARELYLQDKANLEMVSRKVSADAVFQAIPEAIPANRIIPVLFFLVIFLSLEAVIYATANKIRLTSLLDTGKLDNGKLDTGKKDIKHEPLQEPEIAINSSSDLSISNNTTDDIATETLANLKVSAESKPDFSSINDVINALEERQVNNSQVKRPVKPEIVRS